MILNELLEHARNEFTHSMFGLLLMIAVYECSRNVLALKSLLKILDCDGPKCEQLMPFIWGAMPIAYERTVFPEPARGDP